MIEIKVRNDIRQMELIDNSTFEDCLTVGEIYSIEVEDDMWCYFLDDADEPITTLMWRFKEI